MKNILLAIFGLILSLGSVQAAPDPTCPLTMSEFIDRMVSVHHYNRDELVHLFQQTAYMPEVIDRMNKPFEKKPWDFYKSFFITPNRIAAGTQYWHDHAVTLKEASQRYGASPAVIVAIIGIETNYGQETGKYQELGALVTLAFHYPKRATFFQSELENYLMLTREYQLPPLSLYGSYAGALGIPQFMPSSYRKYAVSYEGKNNANLFNNHDDAIASIANYLYKAGWEPDQPIATPAQIIGPVRQWLLSVDAKPIYRLKVLDKFGVKMPPQESPERKAALIALYNTQDVEYWLTFANFRAIMAYNPRATYAMAVYQLSQAIQRNYEQRFTQASAAVTTTR